VRLWDAATGQELLTLRGHQMFVLGIAFSPDGHRLATASWDRTAILWDVFNGNALVTLRGHQQALSSVAFSPDGMHLVTGSHDGTARGYVLDLPELLAMARKRVTRPLTGGECRDYFQTETCPALP
jgi:WD40 repeat protein